MPAPAPNGPVLTLITAAREKGCGAEKPVGRAAGYHGEDESPACAPGSCGTARLVQARRIGEPSGGFLRGLDRQPVVTNQWSANSASTSPLRFFAIPVTVRVAGMNVKHIENHVLLYELFGEGI